MARWRARWEKHRPRRRSCPHRQPRSTIFAPLVDGRPWLVTLVGQRTLSIRRASQQLAIMNLRLRPTRHPAPRRNARSSSARRWDRARRRAHVVPTAHSIVALRLIPPAGDNPAGGREPRTEQGQGTGQNSSKGLVDMGRYAVDHVSATSALLSAFDSTCRLIGRKNETGRIFDQS